MWILCLVMCNIIWGLGAFKIIEDGEVCYGEDIINFDGMKIRDFPFLWHRKLLLFCYFGIRMLDGYLLFC